MVNKFTKELRLKLFLLICHLFCLSVKIYYLCSENDSNYKKYEGCQASNIYPNFQLLQHISRNYKEISATKEV